MNKNMGYFHLTEFDCPQIRLYEDGTFYDEIKQKAGYAHLILKLIKTCNRNY